MRRLICWLRGHRWEPTIITKEWWHTFEDITENGGVTLGFAPGKANGGEFEESYEREVESRRCSFCKTTEWI